MTLTSVEEKKLYKLIKKAVVEALDENLQRLKLEFVPYVEEGEMEEIKTLFGTPKKYKSQKFVEQDL
jgi:hypothetical protein